MKHVEEDSYQKELIWALSHCTDLTQDEIGAHPLVKKSQPAVSRILDEYDPAIDGFEYGASGAGSVEDVDEDFLEQRREAIAELMKTSPTLMGPIGMAKQITSRD